jgi:hypothetical protein
MSDFWERKKITPSAVNPAIAQQLEEGVAEMQESIENLEENNDVFQEEEEDTADIMNDANLRLEQGRLYQMVLQGDIFADTNADPKAIRNVQREIRKFVRERMETMLGIRQEVAVQNTIVSSPFNDMEVTVLKMLASKMSGGETQKVETKTPEPSRPSAPPKKDGISSISGNVGYKGTQPTVAPKKDSKPVAKPQSKPAQQKSALSSADGSALQKSIDDMTPEELAAHDAAAVARRSKNYAAKPPNLIPHPSAQQLEQLYTMQAHDRLTQHAQKMERK